MDAGNKVQDRYEEELNNLKVQRDKLTDKLKLAKNISEDAWDELKLGFKDSAEILKTAINNAWKKFE